MRRLHLGLLLVLALAEPNYVRANADMNTVTNFIDAAQKTSDTFEKAVDFAKQLKRLSGALGLLGAFADLFGSDPASVRHRQVMDEFAKVHNGITKLKEQISFLEANMKHMHMKTRLFPAFEVLRQAMRLSHLNMRTQMIDYCITNQCTHKLEQVARHAPELLEDYIKSITAEKDYVPLVAAYAHRLISIVGNCATIFELSVKDMNENDWYPDPEEAEFYIDDVNEDYIGLEGMSDKIAGLIENSKWHWSQIKANIKLDATALMSQGQGTSTRDVLETLKKGLRPKFNWLSLGILVYNDIWTLNNHAINCYGNGVVVFHESGKNVVIFVKNKKYDSFKGGQIGKSMCLEGNVCQYSYGMAYPGQKYRPYAHQCQVRGGWVDGTATIKRYVGLWFNIPSDYNYCIVNNDFYTIIAIKMY